MAKKLTIQTTGLAAVTITRHAINREKLVYIACANKALSYRHGRSPIVYIGTTRKGVDRIAASAAVKAKLFLSDHGVKQLDFYVVGCAPRKKVKTWRKLERGLILEFRHMFGDPPLGNTQGLKMKWTDELNYFTRQRLESVLKKYSGNKVAERN